MKAVRFGNVQTIKFVHKPEGIQDMFMYHPVTYLEAEQEQVEKDAQKFDYMLIEASGEDLLEVLEHGKEV
jgi:hypothetical protein